MASIQRMKNDAATLHKREMADYGLKGNRARNDELTRERRSKADKTMDAHRVRNDELTADRRETKDGNFNTVIAIVVFVLVVLALGALFVLR
jgi:hypothetical protein